MCSALWLCSPETFTPTGKKPLKRAMCKIQLPPARRRQQQRQLPPPCAELSARSIPADGSPGPGKNVPAQELGKSISAERLAPFPPSEGPRKPSTSLMQELGAAQGEDHSLPSLPCLHTGDKCHGWAAMHSGSSALAAQGK